MTREHTFEVLVNTTDTTWCLLAMEGEGERNQRADLEWTLRAFTEDTRGKTKLNIC